MKSNKPTYVKCRGCGKRILLSLFKYCTDCLKLEDRIENENFSAEARKSFWSYRHKQGLKCCYSGISLEIDDDTSPWYLVFSRMNPGNKNKIAAASALFNAMKAGLTKKEFRYYALALDDHRKKHLRVKKIPLVHWRRLYPPIEGTVCEGCRRAAASKGHKYCPRCARISFRMRRARFPREAIEGVWEYIRKYGFVCYYTGMSLDLDDPKSPWYLVFDHWNPRDPRKIVITSAVVNVMKGDLTEKEFWYFIRQLARFYRSGTPVKKIKLAFWLRPYRLQRRSQIKSRQFRFSIVPPICHQSY